MKGHSRGVSTGDRWDNRFISPSQVPGVKQSKTEPATTEPSVSPHFADWSKAPKEATHHTINEGGVGIWWKGAPEKAFSPFVGLYWNGKAIKTNTIFSDFGDWRQTLEKRPE